MSNTAKKLQELTYELPLSELVWLTQQTPTAQKIIVALQSIARIAGSWRLNARTIQQRFAELYPAHTVPHNSTVRRVLRDLEARGIVEKGALDDELRYELTLRPEEMQSEFSERQRPKLRAVKGGRDDASPGHSYRPPPRSQLQTAPPVTAGSQISSESAEKNDPKENSPQPPKGQGEGERLRAAFARAHAERRSSFTRRTIRKALEAAAENHPDKSRGELVEALIAMARQLPDPRDCEVMHPILWAAHHLNTHFSPPRKPAYPGGGNKEFEPDPRPMRVINVGKLRAPAMSSEPSAPEPSLAETAEVDRRNAILASLDAEGRAAFIASELERMS